MLESTDTVPSKAKIYISFTIALGLALVADCLVFRWQFPDLGRSASYLALAALASC